MGSPCQDPCFLAPFPAIGSQAQGFFPERGDGRHSEELLAQGWTIMDNFFGKSAAEELFAEAESLHKRNLLGPHTFEFATQDGVRRSYHHDGRSFVDLDEGRIRKEVQKASPLLAELGGRQAYLLAEKWSAVNPSWALTAEAGTVQVKLQLTIGESGCAPCHYDTSDTAPSRQLTMLVYLGKDWDSACGGELQLLPFLQEPISIETRFDRAVIFLSDRLLHRTLPTRGEGLQRHRWLLTVWIDGLQVDRPQPGEQWGPLLQRLVAPAVYHEVYAEALADSFPEGEARQALLVAQAEEARELLEDAELSEMIGNLREVVAENTRPLTIEDIGGTESVCIACEAPSRTTATRGMMRGRGRGGDLQEDDDDDDQEAVSKGRADAGGSQRSRRRKGRRDNSCSPRSRSPPTPQKLMSPEFICDASG